MENSAMMAVRIYIGFTPLGWIQEVVGEMDQRLFRRRW